ncbi:MAG: hypothetical protein LH475_02250 [Cryobacterium sp.]|uniref:hypothetical protein n=1 Tax=unclassified Cryobacterium TaxID=2649013 RepID=UPI0018CA66D9|nr:MULTISPECIES: hypothetical protein [unclassified Cryobacterium]MCY7403452.1 hypothetical protein [Cryobacterium sp.]MEC5152747.1 hypothetical protein [Cryobacterium sp. CAN_C3]
MVPEAVSPTDGVTAPVDNQQVNDQQVNDQQAVGRQALEQTREALWAVCEPVSPPKLARDYVNYFSSRIRTNVDAVAKNQPRRLKFYDAIDTYLRVYSAMQNELEQAGYIPREVASIQKEVRFFEDVVREVKQAAGESTD